MAENLFAMLKHAWAVARTEEANLYGVEVAIVTNVRDPEKQGRVKICFPRLPGKPESDWARVAQPAAGPGRGFYWLPEVNDEVLVAFERGQSDKPFVIGALWNGKDKPMKDAYTDENTTRMIQTKSGHQIVLDDKSDEEKITIADKSGKRTLTFDVKEKKFLIEAKEGDFEIHAKKKLVLQCEDLEIKTSKTGKIQIGSKFDLKVTGKASLKAGPKMDIKAGKVHLNPPSLDLASLAAAALAAAARAAAAAAGASAEQQQQAAQAGAAAGGALGGAGGPGSEVVPTQDVAGPAAGAAAGPAGAAAPGGTDFNKARDGSPGGAAGAAAQDGAGAAAAVAPDQLDIQVVNTGGKPQKKLEVELALPSGDKRAGLTDDAGHFKVAGLTEKGNAKLTFPDVQVAPPAPASAAGRIRFVAGGVDVPIGQSSVVEIPPRVRRCRMKGMHFETDKAFLLPSAMTGIRMLVKLYNSFENILGLVNGHSDLQGAQKPGGAEHNRGLSGERAESIKAFLLDDVEGWTTFYGKPANSKSWGVAEDQQMLSTVVDKETSAPFLSPAKGDGQLDADTRGAYKRFQKSRLLTESGSPDKETRRELVTAYMALEGTSLEKRATLETHGCGQTHPLPETAGDPNPNQPANRRVEVYLFEDKIDPQPKTPCPPAGCEEHDKWVAQKILDVDLDQPPGAASVKVVDEAGAIIPGAHVHLAGPLPLDANTTDQGIAQFDEIVPGSYTATANADGFLAADGPVPVPAGGAASATLALKAETFDLDVLVEDQAAKPNPIPNATVSTDRAGVAPQTTGSDGIAHFAKLRRGKIGLTANAKDFLTASVDAVVGPPPAAPPANASALVTAPTAPAPAAGPPAIKMQAATADVRLHLVDLPADLTTEASELNRNWAGNEILLKPTAPAGATAPPPLAPSPAEPVKGTAVLKTAAGSAFTVDQVRRIGLFGTGPANNLPILWKINNGPIAVTAGDPVKDIQLSARARVSIWAGGSVGVLLDPKKVANARIHRAIFKDIKGLDDISIVQTAQMKSGGADVEFSPDFLPGFPKDKVGFLKDALAFLHSKKIQLFVGFEIVTEGAGKEPKQEDFGEDEKKFKKAHQAWEARRAHELRMRKLAAEFAGFLDTTSDFKPAAQKLVDFFDNLGLDIDGIGYDLEIDGPPITSIAKNQKKLEQYFFAVADKLAEKGRYLTFAAGRFNDANFASEKFLKEQPYTIAKHPNIVVRPMAYGGQRAETVKFALNTQGLHPAELQIGVGTANANGFEIDFVNPSKPPGALSRFNQECKDIYRKNRVGVIHWHLASVSRLKACNDHDAALNPGQDPPGTQGQPLQGPLGPQRIRAFADGKAIIDNEDKKTTIASFTGALDKGGPVKVLVADEVGDEPPPLLLEAASPESIAAATAESVAAAPADGDAKQTFADGDPDKPPFTGPIARDAAAIPDGSAENPLHVALGEQVKLDWSIEGKFDKVTLDPGAVDVTSTTQEDDGDGSIDQTPALKDASNAVVQYALTVGGGAPPAKSALGITGVTAGSGLAASLFVHIFAGLKPAKLHSIPARPSGSKNGHDFFKSIATMAAGQPREDAMKKEILAGNIPPFLLNFIEVPVSGGGHTGSIFVSPDYLAVGDDSDFVRVPLFPGTAQAIHDAFGTTFTTSKMVDAIFTAATVKIDPVGTGGDGSNKSILDANDKFVQPAVNKELKATGLSQGELTNGAKKDIILNTMLKQKPHPPDPKTEPDAVKKGFTHEGNNAVIIYGWHQIAKGKVGVPIQGEVDWHSKVFSDYSHGVRLVSQKMVVDGAEMDLFDVLKGFDTVKAVADKTLMALLVKNTGDPLLPIPPRYP